MNLRKQGYSNALKQANLYDDKKILDLEFQITEEERIDKISKFFNDNETDAILFGANYLLQVYNL